MNAMHIALEKKDADEEVEIAVKALESIPEGEDKTEALKEKESAVKDQAEIDSKL